MFKKLALLLILLQTAFTGVFSQYSGYKPMNGSRMLFPDVAVKTNLLYDLTSSINLGAELRLSDYLSMDLPVSYNPWTFSDNRKFKHVLIQPELRYWVYEPFNGHFFGSHLLYSHFNAGNLPFGSLRENRYQGDAYGLGISYGYQWILSGRWNLEATIGLGYMHLDYSRYQCNGCGEKLGEGRNNYFGPTKAGISLIYLLK